MSSDGMAKLNWVISPDLTTITFTLAVRLALFVVGSAYDTQIQTNGWISVGVTKSQYMRDACDYWVGWVDDVTAKAYLLDTWGDTSNLGYMLPFQDIGVVRVFVRAPVDCVCRTSVESKAATISHCSRLLKLLA